MYYWFVHGNNESSLVVGWLEVELLRNLRFCGWCCVRRESGLLWIAAIVWIARQCVAHWADSAELCYEVYECAICEPLPLQCATWYNVADS